VTSIIASWFIEFQPCVTSVRGIFVIPVPRDTFNLLFGKNDVSPCLPGGKRRKKKKEEKKKEKKKEAPTNGCNMR